MRKIIGLVAAALVATACGGNGSDPTSKTSAGSITSSSLAVSITSGPGSTTPIPSTTPSTTTAAPIPVLGVELLVAGPDGVFLLREDGQADLVIDSPAVFAIDDLSGGVLFQVERRARDRRSIVYRVSADGSTVIQTLVPTTEQGLVLNGIAVDGEETYVYYSRREGSRGEDASETLRRYSLQTREVTELVTVGGLESGSFPISISESLVLYNWSGEGLHGMSFADLRGNEAAVAGNPTPSGGYEDCFECPHLGELSPDGSLMVYWEFDRGQQAVIKHVASGAEVRRIAMPMTGDDASVISFDLSPRHLVVNLVTVDEREPSFALIYDLSQVNPEPTWLDIPGEAYITLAPVTVSGPVSGP